MTAVLGVAAALLCVVGALAGAWAITGSAAERRAINPAWWWALDDEQRAAWRRWLLSYGIDPHTVPLDGAIERRPSGITVPVIVGTLGGWLVLGDALHVRRRRVRLLHPPSPFPT